MEIQKILMKKRDGEELTEFEIKYFIENVTNGNLTDSQIGAMLMAIFIRGLTTKETIKMTEAMINSGDLFKWNTEWADVAVDKHSTGGVGDKISVVLAPALAACGLKVPMISGRSLAFTGGTLDKLESIPGFNVNLSKSELKKCLESAGCFISGTTDNLCPGDRILYKKRNETSTIDYINLITCSIISKKAVEGIKYLILDIKIGKGTFMKDLESARSLARQLVNVSKELGIKTKAIITKMDHPLGKAVGNSLEITECLNLMKGNYVPHIQDLVTIFGGNLLEMSGKARNLQHGKEMIEKSLKNGTALEHFYKMLISQGVQEEIAKKLCYGNENESPIQLTKYKTEIVSAKSGWIVEIDAFTIGDICQILTNGSSNNNEIDLSAGVYIKKTVGEFIETNEPWLIVHHSTSSISMHDQQRLERSLKITSKDRTNLLSAENSSLILEYVE